jgi:glycosyltransferase involved in cell wall biosynthesis
LPWAIKRSTATRTVGKTTAEVLMKWGAPERKLNVVPSFYLDRSLIESLGPVPPVHYDVVFCGRLVANKGIDNIFRAMEKMSRGSLLVIGDGPERKKLEALAKELKISHRIEFRGWLPTQRDVLQAIRSAKVLVMNSLSEGGPRVPLEAMAAGMPVIVTRVGVMPDVIIDGKNGLFTNGHPDDLAAKIERVLGDAPWRQSMGDEAKAILNRFERSILIAQYARFLRTCATSTSPSYR